MNPFFPTDDLENIIGMLNNLPNPAPTMVSACIVTQKKNGGIRLYMDSRALNECMATPSCHFPSFETIKTKLKGASYFTVLDAGPNLIPLAEESKNACTIATPTHGLVKYNYLPGGLPSGRVFYHQALLHCFGNISNVIVFADELLIFASSFDDNKRILERVLSAARDSEMKFNPKTCSFTMPQVKFAGHYCSARGMFPDESIIDLIHKMKTPARAKEVRQFLALINLYFTNMSADTAQLKKLSQKSSSFEWKDVHAKEFDQLKTKVRKLKPASTK